MVFLSLHDLPNRKRFESSIKDRKKKEGAENKREEAEKDMT